jgi:ATP-dependent exoDNAse (exonuclease V) beta subunit
MYFIKYCNKDKKHYLYVVMENGSLTIYNASAGSGKTYTLTSVYLKYVFKSRHNYRKILAVTFTYKAMAEMKSRILENLYRLGVGEESGYLEELTASLNKSEAWVRAEAKEILNLILHDYSRFSITTIDSFFQKILRAFTREVGLHSGFSVELENERILSEAVRRMIRSAAMDAQLKDWLTLYALSNIEEEKTWNLKEAILKLSNELFNEKFKMLSAGERSLLEDKQYLRDYIKGLKSLIFSIENQLKALGVEAEKFFTKFGLNDSMFYQKARGVPAFVKLLLTGEIKEPNSYVLKITDNPPQWSTGLPAANLQSALDAGLEKLLLNAIQFINSNLIGYKSAEAILSNIYSLGILSDVLKNVHLITNDENSFLLSETGEFINLVIGGDQTSFIYEKTGTKFTNFMIDEFQDTSVIQWNNFEPLIDNSLAEGNDNLIVGDVKQSIYRWRNSDWSILGVSLKNMVDNKRIISQSLATNWRSCNDIIKFNNRLFTIIPDLLDKAFETQNLPVSFKNLYSEAIQKSAGKQKGGYVNFQFIDDTDEHTWEELALQKMPETIGNFLKKGYKPSDIGIIVRYKKEGALTLKTLIDYNNLPDNERVFGSYRVMSDDSLELGASPALCFIIAVLKTINDPCDLISKALMLRLFLLATGDDRAETVSLESGDFDNVAKEYFPDGYKEALDKAGNLPLFEATEKIIMFFGLGDKSWNVAYINAFQDLVLNYSSTKNASLSSFIEWWETTGNTKSVVLPGNQDAVRILTIHKSKGLEFKVVIVPFVSWNLDHFANRAPILWVKPSEKPFDKLGIVPVKYAKNLKDTIFANDYLYEKYSVYIDNINLLYVAFTRAKEALCGFSEKPKSEASISAALLNALTYQNFDNEANELNLCDYYNPDTGIFEFGVIKEQAETFEEAEKITVSEYHVTNNTLSLRLKFSGENYFSESTSSRSEKINYGKIMHEVFAGISTSSDVAISLKRLSLEGKIPENEIDILTQKINNLISAHEISEWFHPDNIVLRETGIILPSGLTRRPDRVVIRNGKATIIDFKFGKQNQEYNKQLSQYKEALAGMGYDDIAANIWYVDENIVVAI